MKEGKGNLRIYSLQKKMLLASKGIGAVLILSYIFSTKLPFSSEYSLAIWVLFVVVLILLVDFLMNRFLSKPIARLVQAAGRMAELDFSSPCTVRTGDEFEDLAAGLNIMAANLQNALQELEASNGRLAREAEQERVLLEERRELVDRLSHEMKTPLGIIRAYTEGLQEEEDVGKQLKYAEVILAETEQMSDLITTLLDLSALETGAKQLIPTRFDLVELLETAAGRLLIDTPDADFELQYELPDHSVYVYADRSRMEQVLNNLIINAKKNVCPGGILRLCLREEGEWLRFSIYDQGSTIPEEDLEKIWTKFYRGSGSGYSGSGLGLTIVAQILSMQKVSYGAENLADGVQFYFSIPMIQ